MKDEIIARMETLENCVKINFFRAQRKWTMDMIAYEMGFNLQRMIEWVNSRAVAIAQTMKTDPAVTKNLMAQLERDYPLPKVEKVKKLKLDVTRVVKFLKEGLSLQEIAKKFHCKYNNYRIWHNENLGLINQRMKNV